MEITHDAFLGGKLTIAQPRKGYRAGVDAVLLAASVPAQQGQRVLDIGCGVGTAALCLGARIPGLEIWGFDAQEDLVHLAQHNARENAAPQSPIHFFQAQLGEEKILSPNSFDHVLTNPPYFRRAHSYVSSDPIKSIANFETMALAQWIQGCLRYVRPQGMLSVIHCVTRLDDLLQAVHLKKRAIKIIPLWPHQKAPAKRVIVQVIKDSAAPLSVSYGLVLHEQGCYTAEAEEILRHGGPLDC